MAIKNMPFPVWAVFPCGRGLNDLNEFWRKSRQTPRSEAAGPARKSEIPVKRSHEVPFKISPAIPSLVVMEATQNGMQNEHDR